MNDYDDAGYMTKIAAIPIYGNDTLKIFFPGTRGPNSMKLGMNHRRLKPIIFCTNDNPGLTLTFSMARSNFCNRLLYGKI